MKCLIAGALVFGVLLWGTEPARPVECPVPHPTTTSSALQESRQTIQELSELFAAQGTGVVPEIIAQLKHRYPAAQDAEITDHLVSLYCPVVNRDGGLSDAEKADRLAAFSEQVMQSLAGR
jgi:hypothetical protein